MKSRKIFLFVLSSLLLVGCNGTSYEEVSDSTEANTKLQEAAVMNQEAIENVKKAHIKTKLIIKGEENDQKVDVTIEQEYGFDYENGVFFQKSKNGSNYLQSYTKVSGDSAISYYKGEASVNASKYSVACKKEVNYNQKDYDFSSIIDSASGDFTFADIEIDSDTIKLYSSKDGGLKITVDVDDTSEDSGYTYKVNGEMIIDANGLVKHIHETMSNGTATYSLTSDFDYTKSGIPSIKESDYTEATEADGIALVSIATAITSFLA